LVSILDTKSQNIPEVVVVRRGAGGILGSWGGVGQLGEGEQTGSVYKQPEREVDDSCHNWREPSKWKRTQRGGKGKLAGGARGARGIAPCIYVTVMCVPE
jgi:hypothetical protein